MKKIITLTLLYAALTAAAAIPEGYYNILSGKKESALKEAARSLAKDHTVIKYGEDTWSAFELTDVILVNGRAAWRDMYSNEIVWVATGHGSLNIEHSVPKSWWGGTVNDAYQDLFHLNPSNPGANNRKSNWPLGEITSISWTNGLTTLGTPNASTGGGAKTVFEPADRYKGDFARAYFYIFTTYDALDWDPETAWMYLPDDREYPTLQDWAVKMLLDWAAKDPVDAEELTRNEAIYGLQGNRNPFIDIPELAEYIWGSRKGQTFSATGLEDPKPIERPAAPEFGDYTVTEFNTYSGRWWDAFTLTLKVQSGAFTVYRIDGGDWVPYGSGIAVDAATVSGETLTIEARSEWEVDGLTLTSPVSRLVLTAKDPDVIDYKDATWRAVTENDEITDDDYCILVSNKTYNIMSVSGEASSSNKYLLTAGTVEVKDGWVISIPEKTALLSFIPARSVSAMDIYDADQYVVTVSDIAGNRIGDLYSKTARQMIISTTDFSPVTLSFREDASIINFGDQGRLQFNTSSPRFVPYTSIQEPVTLYVFDPEGPAGVMEIAHEEGTGVVRFFDLQGRELNGEPSASGLYIRITDGHPVKILVR